MNNPVDFWGLIAEANSIAQGSMERKCDLIRRTVSALPANEAQAFSHCFDEAMKRAYSWELWGAAYVINGGCSDDTFSDFRASLISRGRAAFDNAIADPDSLANEPFDENEWFFEGFQYAVHEGAESALSPQKLSALQMPGEPSGKAWDENPEVLKAQYPKLWARFEETAVAQPQPKPEINSKKAWWRFW